MIQERYKREMNKIIALAVIFLVSGASFAARYRQSGEDVSVNGYYRSNGTYVQPYYRSQGNAYKWDNYNYQASQPAYNPTYYQPQRNYNSNYYQPNPGRLYDSNPYNNNSPSYGQ